MGPRAGRSQPPSFKGRAEKREEPRSSPFVKVHCVGGGQFLIPPPSGLPHLSALSLPFGLAPSLQKAGRMVFPSPWRWGRSQRRMAAHGEEEDFME